MNGETAKLFPRIHFRPEINLGHILQIIALGGAVIGAYNSLRSSIELQHSEFRVAMAGYESRLTVAEHGLAERRSEEREFAAEMRASLADIQKLLTDIRLQAARAKP